MNIYIHLFIYLFIYLRPFQEFGENGSCTILKPFYFTSKYYKALILQVKHGFKYDILVCQ